MKKNLSNRRDFLKNTAAASGITLLSGISTQSKGMQIIDLAPPRIRFAVINI